MIDAHGLNRGGHGVQSPADRLLAAPRSTPTHAGTARLNPRIDKAIGQWEAIKPKVRYAARPAGLDVVLRESK